MYNFYVCFDLLKLILKNYLKNTLTLITSIHILIKKYNSSN